jgi:hypothetical protein
MRGSATARSAALLETGPGGGSGCDEIDGDGVDAVGRSDRPARPANVGNAAGGRTAFVGERTPRRRRNASDFEWDRCAAGRTRPSIGAMRTSPPVLQRTVPDWQATRPRPCSRQGSRCAYCINAAGRRACQAATSTNTPTSTNARIPLDAEQCEEIPLTPLQGCAARDGLRPVEESIPIPDGQALQPAQTFTVWPQVGRWWCK